MFKANDGAQCMIATQVGMFLSIHFKLLDNTNLLMFLVDGLNSRFFIPFIFFDFQIISQESEFFSGSMIEMKLLGKCFNPLISNKLIMQKPIKILSLNFNIIGHNFFKSLVISNDKQVNHNNVTHFKSVYHLWESHVTKCVYDYESCLRVVFYVCFDLG